MVTLRRETDSVRILFVSLHFPYPTVTHGGGTDLFHLIETLSERRHEIDLVSFIRPSEQQHARSMDAYCRRVATVLPSAGWRQRFDSVVRQAVSHPWRIGQRASWLLGQTLDEMLATSRYDAVQFVYTNMGGFIPRVQGRAVTVLDEVDVNFLPLLNRYQRANGWWARLLAWKRYRQGLAQEVAYCRSADQVFVRSARDLAALTNMAPDVRGAVLKPWTHLDENLTIASERPEGQTILFVGAMNRRENIESALYFYQECFPRIRTKVPTALFCIAGADPASEIVRLASQDSAVTVTGRVPSLRPYYEGASVCVAPILHDGGVMNKVIDGMAAARPVVTTSNGNAGVGAAPGEHLLVADDASAFADVVVSVLASRSLWARLACAGREFVTGEFDWNRTVSAYEQLMSELVARRSTA